MVETLSYHFNEKLLHNGKTSSSTLHSHTHLLFSLRTVWQENQFKVFFPRKNLRLSLSKDVNETNKSFENLLRAIVWRSGFIRLLFDWKSNLLGCWDKWTTQKQPPPSKNVLKMLIIKIIVSVSSISFCNTIIKKVFFSFAYELRKVWFIELRSFMLDKKREWEKESLMRFVCLFG